MSKETGQGATPLTRPTTGVMAHRTRDRRIGLSCPGKTILICPQGCRVHIDCPLQTYSPEFKGNLFIAWLKNSLTTRMPGCVTSCRWMDSTENLTFIISGSSENGGKHGKWPCGGPDWLVGCRMCLRWESCLFVTSDMKKNVFVCTNNFWALSFF